MSVDITAETLLADYLQRYLWADEDWLQNGGASATYCQARLAQTTTVELDSEGWAKWRIRTRIVAQVPDSAEARQVCLSLNRYAAGWSFAYNAADQTVDAIAAAYAPPQWDTFLLRLSETAKLSAWMCDVIAERLAETLGGVPAFSHPATQADPREEYDGTYHYLETLRGRPEWILDLTRYRFEAIEDIASVTATFVGAQPESVQCDGDALRIAVGTGLDLAAGFDKHPVFGAGWRSSLVLRPRPATAAVSEYLSAMTWALFDGTDTNLLGGWAPDTHGLTFQQWNTMSEIRNQEQLDSYTGHSATDLWGFTSTLSDVMVLLSQRQPPPDGDSGPGGDAAERADTVIAAISEQARPAVTERPEEGEAPADRRLLWLEHRQTLAVAAWFNPMGPTVTSTEVCALPDGTEYLVHFRRHPFAPYYRVVGMLKPEGDESRLLSEATDLLFGASLPNVLTLWNNPNAEASEVPEVLRDRIREIACEDGKDLAANAAWVERTKGNPWEFAAVDQTEAQSVKAAARDAAAANPSPDGGFAAWWQQVSGFDNVLANFRFLPEAWDGSLNTQRAFGNLGNFDVGPLLVTYSKIGMPGT